MKHTALIWPMTLGIVFSACATSNEYNAAPQEQTAPPIWQASGTEPFWSLTINSDYLIMRTPSQERPAYFPYTPLTQHNGVAIYSGHTESSRIEVKFQWRECQDSMSGVVRPWTAEVLYVGQTYWGCASGLPKQ